jgi:glycosyltransferase involved in cell wall biosynthesis
METKPETDSAIGGNAATEAASGRSLSVAIWNASGLPPVFTTGVGKVYINIALEFERMASMHPSLILPRDDSATSEPDPSKSPLGHLSRRRLPLNRVHLEFLWRTLGSPGIDRWAGDADWVYCPRELWCCPGRLRYAITVHDVYQFEPGVWSGSWRMKLQRNLVWQRAIDRADVVFTVSEFTRGRILALFRCDPSKIRVTPNAVDPIFWQPRLAVKPTFPVALPEEPFVLQVGGLTRKKGAASILALAKELARRRSVLRIVVIGPVEPEFRAEAAERDNLVILDRGLGAEAIRWITEEARVAILPSEYEGFGIPLLEAMTVGVPAVGSCHASLPEISGCAKRIVNPALTEAFADLVQSLHDDPAERSAAIAHGHRRAARYSWSSTAETIRETLFEFH